MTSCSSPQGPIRILEVVDTLDSGGMEQQIIALCNRLPADRFSFEFCCLRHEGILAPKLKPETPLHALNKPEGFRWQAVTQLRAILRTGRFDLVHTHNLGPLIYAAMATNGGCRVPILHGEHAQLNAGELTTKRTWQRKLLYGACRAVHTVSFSQREELLRRGLNHPRLIALQNGVDTTRFRPLDAIQDQASARSALSLPPNGFIIGIVARFGQYKRHADLVQAFLPLAQQHPEATLVMVGDGGPERERVLAMIESSGKSRSQCVAAGFQKDPAPWYQLFDALIVPSENEGLSNVTLEAMASGVPVLSNDICGARELIEEGAGGWIRDLNSVAKLTAELNYLFHMDGTARRQVGRAGRERACRLFSWEGMANAYADCFESCATRL